MSKTKSLTKISEILPEGLSEETVEQIFALVDETIKDQVSEKIGLLEAKVTAFLRTKVDQIKDQAMEELAEESEVFRNAKLFESVKSLMSLEITESDKDSAVNDISTQFSELQEEFDLVVKNTEQVLLENEKLKNAVKVLNTRNKQLTESVKTLNEEKEQLLEEVTELEASEEMDFESSEKAIIFSKAEKINEGKEFNDLYVENQFLTKEVLEANRLLAN